NHVVENFANRRRILSREAMHEFERHLRGADFRRVNAACHEDDDLALPENVVALARAWRATLKVELPLEFLVAVDVLQRVCRADFDGDEWIPVRRFSQVTDADAIGSGRDELHVLDDLVPSRELVVRTGLEP